VANLTITAIKVWLIEIPARAVHSHGSGDVGKIRSVLLEFSTDAGISGWGEASPWPVFTGTAEGNIAALHVHLRPLLLGADPFRVEALMAQADKTIVGYPEAKAAVETALLDIVGKALNSPLYNLIGGKCRDEIPLSFSIANPDFDEDLQTVQQLVDDGVHIFKMKTGFAEHRFDLLRLEKLRGRYGDSIDLRVDYNQGMQPYEAITRLRDIEQFHPTFIEQPVPRANLETMIEITRVLDTPILADESVFDAREAYLGAQQRIADLFSLKIMKSGGIRRALEVAAIARAAGIGVYGGCMFETGIAHTAGSHLMAAVPDLRLGCEFYMSSYYLQEDILAEPFAVHNGKVVVPDGPGLGIGIEQEKLRKYTLEIWQ
jgi:muconate cycloisomerase